MSSGRPTRPRLWLLLARQDAPGLAYVAPTLAWAAKDAGAAFETYWECERDGELFAEAGSTILGGQHHQQFNLLCAVFDVAVLRLGPTGVFDSSVATFGLPILAEAADPAGLYARLADQGLLPASAPIVVGPSRPVRMGSVRFDVGPYLFPEIIHRRAVGFGAGTVADGIGDATRATAFYLDDADQRTLRGSGLAVETGDSVGEDDGPGTVTLRIAERWRGQARAVVFGDPTAVFSQVAAHCRHDRVAVFGPCETRAPRDVRVSTYTESVSPVAGLAADLAVALGDRTIHGRQTGDGDIFEWSKRGVGIQIVDPNRPPFPILAERPQAWAPRLRDDSVEEVDDAQLAAWADEGRVLTTATFHSGEVAHNEAMVALLDLAAWSGLRCGFGVHAQRYESCPQLFEMIQVPPSHGGLAGRVEPLLHSGGLGVLAECECPPDLLGRNIGEALDRIRAVAGADGLPRGYLAFMDSNLDRLDSVRGDLFRAIEAAGLDHIVSSALPGRNRLLWRGRDGAIAINQTPRVVQGSSPFVRATTPEDIDNTTGSGGAGWIVATFDAPVIAFARYAWTEGGRFMRVIERLKAGRRINVVPSVVARYARLLAERGLLPAPIALDAEPARYRS
ncbi:hypothetical protein [Sphingomonas lenta]|uniref:hypothetical protein n=1 Tax=Sphingomonas lenta TaxID=1141887 RepID=UPI001C3EAB16|nr:hypothetical protein [Sphingomonas lenta]